MDGRKFFPNEYDEDLIDYEDLQFLDGIQSRSPQKLKLSVSQNNMKQVSPITKNPILSTEFEPGLVEHENFRVFYDIWSLFSYST